MKTLLFTLVVALSFAGCKEECVTCTTLSILTSSDPLDTDYPRIDSSSTEFCNTSVDNIIDSYSGTILDTLPDSTVITTNFTRTCVE